MTVSYSIVVLVSCLSFISNRKEFLIPILIQVPDQCENEVYGIECLYTCFIYRYHGCPDFFLGFLQDACQAAFNSPMIKEVRLYLLLQLHIRLFLFSIAQYLSI